MALDFEEDYETYAGTRLFQKKGRPATNTEAAFETFFGSDAHEITITSVGSVEGREYSTSSVSVVSSGRNREKKGEFTFGSGEFSVLWLPDQVGQVEAAELRDSYDVASYAKVDQNGGVVYFTAQVSNFTEAGGGNNDARTGTLNLLRQSDAVVALTPVVPAEDVTP